MAMMLPAQTSPTIWGAQYERKPPLCSDRAMINDEMFGDDMMESRTARNLRVGDSRCPTLESWGSLFVYPIQREQQSSASSRLQHYNRLNFIRCYLRTVGKESQIEEERMMSEIRLFSLASDLFWGLWSIVNAKLSQIPFGYWDYAVTRLRHYQYLKEKILVSGPLFPESGVKRKVTQLD